MKKAQPRQRPRDHQRTVKRRRALAQRPPPRRLQTRGDAQTLLAESIGYGYFGAFAQGFALIDDVQRRYPTCPGLASKRAYLSLLSGDLSPETYRDLRAGRDGRPKVQGMGAFDRAGVPLWEGQPIAGQRLLIWVNPGGFGYGDIIQTVRLVPHANTQSQAATVTLGLPPGLAPLCHRLSGVDAWCETPLSSLEGIDAHCPMEWLPVAVPVTEAILAGVPYLQADPEAIERWHPTFADRSVKRYGLHWKADQAHGNWKPRTMRLQDLAELFTVAGVQWYSLQKGGSSELAPFPQIIDLGEVDRPDAKFVETAALLSLMDGVVCIDSSIGHLAGALGVPVEMCLSLPWDPQWSSFDTARGRSLWYPGHRVWMPHGAEVQGRPGDQAIQQALWASVVGQIGEALSQ